MTVFGRLTSIHRQCFPVSINTDDISEEDESFFLTVRLSPFFGPQEGTVIGLNTTEITILDDDSKCMGRKYYVCRANFQGVSGEEGERIRFKVYVANAMHS